MTEAHRPKEPMDRFSKEEAAWAAANLPALHRMVRRQRFVRDALVIAFVVGLAAHIGGYLILSAATGEPLRLVADLLATLGTALWTGVVLYAFVNVLPAAPQRAAARWLETYEAEIRQQGQPVRRVAGADAETPRQNETPRLATGRRGESTAEVADTGLSEVNHGQRIRRD